MRALPLVLLVATAAAACGGSPAMPDAAPLVPTANPGRVVVDTQLHFDVTALTATATVTFGPSADPGASLEIGDLMIDSVMLDGQPLPFAVTGKQLDLALAPQLEGSRAVDVAYHYKTHEGFTGASINGYTLVWPYYCGNLFPCHSQPADGTTFSLDVAGVSAGKTAVFPATIPSAAPSYQIAWSIDSYTELPLGTTTAGTQLSVWYRPTEDTAAAAGTAHLVAAFDWFEKTLGPYHFGPKYGSVSVNWPRGAYGGMEHHPISHIASAAIGSEETHVHEAAHGWFGDGIRIACWEDFVLSEGTVSYLAARALDVVAPAVGTQTWNAYQSQLNGISGTDPVWPDSCGTVDIIKDNLFTNAPYMRGAFFYKAVADKIGADKVDQALAAFYAAHAGQAAKMADMLATIQAVTGYDATTCAQLWLRSKTIPTPGPCP